MNISMLWLSSVPGSHPQRPQHPLTTHPQWALFPLLPLPPSPLEGQNTSGSQPSSPFSSYSNALLSISSLHNYSNADLKAKNYLNSSEPVPPNPSDFCLSYSPGDKIGAKSGVVTLSKSRMHQGTGARIQRVLNKAQALFLAAQVALFPFLFPHTPNSTYE